LTFLFHLDWVYSGGDEIVRKRDAPSNDVNGKRLRDQPLVWDAIPIAVEPGVIINGKSQIFAGEVFGDLNTEHNPRSALTREFLRILAPV
jgi:hypothetical protein